MTNAIEITQYDLPPRALIEALASDAPSTEKSMLMVRLRSHQELAHAAFKEQSDNFDKLYDEIAHGDADAAYLVQMAEIVLQNERAAAERLRPEMQRLQEKLAGKDHKLDPEIREHFQESLDIAGGWLDLYKTLRTKLLALSLDRKPGLKDIPRAHPVVGDIDHEALTREIIARFPNILAALAR